MSFLNAYLILMDVSLIYGFYLLITTPSRDADTSCSASVLNEGDFMESFIFTLALSTTCFLIPLMLYLGISKRAISSLIYRRRRYNGYKIDMPWHLSSVYYDGVNTTDDADEDILDVWARELHLNTVPSDHENWERWITAQQILYKIKRLP